MSIFRSRRDEIETLAVPSAFDNAQELGGLACGSSYCAENDPSSQELSSREDQLMERIVQGTELWAYCLSEGREIAADIQTQLFASHQSKMQLRGMNHQAVRNASRDIHHTIATDMVKFRNLAKADVEKAAKQLSGGDSVFGIAMSGNGGRITRASMTLEGFFDKRLAQSKEDIAKPRRGGWVNLHDKKSALNPYHRVFTAEALTKLRLGKLMSEYPDTAAELLHPRNLANLSEDFQRFVATDIANDQRSLVLNFMLVKRKKAIDFFEYLGENNLATAAKDQAQAMSIVAKALGACNCPMNDVGLCRSVAERVSEVGLPKDITEDMNKKQQTGAQRLNSQLLDFARKYKVSDWWSMEPEVNAQTRVDQQPRVGSKKSARAKGSQHKGSGHGTSKSFTDSLSEPITREIQAPDRVVISQAGIDGIYEVSKDAEPDKDAVVNVLLSSKEFASYIKRYQHDKDLEPFLREALKTIMFAPTYHEVQGISKVMYRKNFPHITNGNEKLHRYKLSGKDFQGHSGDAVWSTRISFGVSNGSGVRRIEIIGVDHKTKIEKASMSGRFYNH